MITILIQGRFLKKSQPLRDGQLMPTSQSRSALGDGFFPGPMGTTEMGRGTAQAKMEWTFGNTRPDPWRVTRGFGDLPETAPHWTLPAGRG
jgi:hypothetical protein